MNPFAQERLNRVCRPDDGDIRRLVSRVHGKSTGRIELGLDGTKGPIKVTISTGGSRGKVGPPTVITWLRCRWSLLFSRKAVAVLSKTGCVMSHLPGYLGALSRGIRKNGDRRM